MFKSVKDVVDFYKFSNVKYFGDKICKVDGKGKKKAKLILVSAMTSNKEGIGKTTLSIGLADAFSLLGDNVLLSLREASMGPVFGVKGGACGGGKSVLAEEEEINLNFTGDFHAITAANNLLSSIIDNHIYFGNKLMLDTNKITFRRCIDLNERSLREIQYKIGDKKIKTGFDITAASEVMAIMCLSKSLKELKQNLGDIMIGYNTKNQPVYARDLHAENAMLKILKNAFKPNLVLTKAGTPALVHLGPFANIAHGCSSISATKLALSHSDYVITEAGFGSDLGGEKFYDIKSRLLNKVPDIAVLTVTLGAALEQGGGDLNKGFLNISRHIEILREFNANIIVAINKHKNDDKKLLKKLKDLILNEGVCCEICDPFNLGAKGCQNLVSCIKNNLKTPKKKFIYELTDSNLDKIKKLSTKIYGAKNVKFSKQAAEKLKNIEAITKGYFVCVAKTQLSISDNKNLLGAPKDYTFNVTDIIVRSGAKMVVVVAGKMLFMPGLAKNSRYEKM